jgi:8-oxo-dGTP pyrophosphatase MutT (NUDIX family)
MRDLVDAIRRAVDPDPRHEPAPGDRLAAVLAPLVVEDDPSLLFTTRHEELTRHPGEVSFPGGLPEDGEALEAAALRETQEEVGIDPAAVEILGALAPVHTTVSGILIVPFVGVLIERQPIRPNPAEIANVFEVTVDRLLAVERVVELERKGERFETYLFDVGDAIVWGATGRILHDLLEVVRGRSA